MFQNALTAVAPDPCTMWDRECGNEPIEAYRRPLPPVVRPGERTVDMRLGSSFTVRLGAETLTAKLTQIGGAGKDLLGFTIEYRDAKARVMQAALTFAAGRITGFGLGNVSFLATAAVLELGTIRVKLNTTAQILAG